MDLTPPLRSVVLEHGDRDTQGTWTEGCHRLHKSFEDRDADLHLVMCYRNVLCMSRR